MDAVIAFGLGALASLAASAIFWVVFRGVRPRLEVAWVYARMFMPVAMGVSAHLLASELGDDHDSVVRFRQAEARGVDAYSEELPFRPPGRRSRLGDIVNDALAVALTGT